MIAQVGLGTWVIPLGALLVSFVTLVYTARGMRHRARVDYVDELESRIEECETDRKDLRKKLEELKQENFNLMRRLMRLENGK